MADNSDFPSIEPDKFDLIIVGTGLQEAILAAAAASAGQSVLHLDPNSFYGSFWTSLSFHEFNSWASSQGRFTPGISFSVKISDIPSEEIKPENSNPSDGIKNPEKSTDEIINPENSSDEMELQSVGFRPLYSDFETKCFDKDVVKRFGKSKDFNLDIAGPKLSFCGGPMIDLVLKSGAHNYLNFSSVERSYIWVRGQGLVPVPDSKEALFQDEILSLAEKRHLMRFFKLVKSHQTGHTPIAADDLERPFSEFLHRQQLSSLLKSIILYAIALTDYDQEDECTEADKILSTKKGIEGLILYFSSIGRFANASGPFLYPVCGSGELPQIFSRAAAVKGALYVLRMPMTGVFVSKDSGSFKGIQLASGQLLFSSKIIVNPSIVLPKSLSVDATREARVGELEQGTIEDVGSHVTEGAEDSSLRMNLMPIHTNRKTLKLLRAICLTDQSLHSELSTLLVIFPPKSILSSLQTVIRALQLGNNTCVCPKGLFVVSFSTVCSDLSQGKEALNVAMNSLFTLSTGEDETDSHLNDANESEVAKPTLLWSTVFAQELEHSKILTNQIEISCMPDESLGYQSLVGSTIKMYNHFFSDKELFSQENLKEEDNGDGENEDTL